MGLHKEEKSSGAVPQGIQGVYNEQKKQQTHAKRTKKEQKPTKQETTRMLYVDCC